MDPFVLHNICVVHCIWFWWWWNFSNLNLWLLAKIWLGLTMFLVIWSSRDFSSLLKWPTCVWLNNIWNTLWLWRSQATKSCHSMSYTKLPFNLIRHSHFLLPVVLPANLSFYFLYFPLYSQANKSKVFLPVSNISIKQQI